MLINNFIGFLGLKYSASRRTLVIEVLMIKLTICCFYRLCLYDCRFVVLLHMLSTYDL
ncbi:hypothetical protein GIB67_005079 [Kingdonia uniflora]|uniref:Uncharacterized protein n=1 Tax=Kingdonia uniflora TaxID=39325 RepID=A0A7J7KUN3_9MAGN|nr:hypothetical protein GIB67_005079 [Kingdonia uniflora]